MSAIPPLLSRALRAESLPRCAYFHSAERLLGLRLEADHIIPASCGGQTDMLNLCLCCRACDGYKGERLRARDPKTGRKCSGILSAALTPFRIAC